MRLLWKLTAASFLVPPAFFVVSGRSLGELFDLARAAASTITDRSLEQVPTEVRDKKLDHDLELQRRRLTDQKVSLQLSRREIGELSTQVDELEERAARRKRLLGEALPVLEQATQQSLAVVSFAGSEHELAEFQRQIDVLLAEEEREQRQLEIRRAGLEKLTTSLAEGEAALQEMEGALIAWQQEVELLRTRREQAEFEGRTLEIVAATQANGLAGPTAGEVGAEAEALRKEVGRMEAENQARREALPGAAAPQKLSRDWERLERLRAVQAAAAPAVTPGAAASERASEATAAPTATDETQRRF
ncbi:MAG: hypothetical protein JNM84_07590 [Planctomycetes bacterium]|nr:hypothetical protein [Planctomycetota bacterium]